MGILAQDEQKSNTDKSTLNLENGIKQAQTSVPRNWKGLAGEHVLYVAHTSQCRDLPKSLGHAALCGPC